jgi:hypothetical protein
MMGSPVARLPIKNGECPMLAKFEFAYALFAEHFDVIFAAEGHGKLMGIAEPSRELKVGVDYWIFERSAEGWQVMCDLVQQLCRRRSYLKYHPLSEAPENIYRVRNLDELRLYLARGAESGVSPVLVQQPHQFEAAGDWYFPPIEGPDCDEINRNRIARFLKDPPSAGEWSPEID